MLHEIGIELQAQLRARSCPLPVIDGPEATETAARGRERIVIEHDERDRFSGAVGQSKNPKQRMLRSVGAKIRIYAQSTSSGALDFEHRRRAEHILDLVLVSMSEIQSVRKGRQAFVPSGGGFVKPDALADTQVWGGAVYELTFEFDRAVFEQTWAGDKKPEATLTDGSGDGLSISTGTRRVSVNGGNVESF